MNKPYVLENLNRVRTNLGKRAGLFRHHIDGVVCTACVNSLLVDKVISRDVRGRLDRVPGALAT